MKWKRGYQSSHVEDRRGASGTSSGAGPLLFIARLVATKFGIAGLLIVGVGYVVMTRFIGIDPTALTGKRHTASATQSGNDDAKSFVSFVLDDAQSTWDKAYPAGTGEHYQPARLVLFTAKVSSACGMASAATGPFYCPRDHKVYIDLAFYRTLKERLGAPGDFAQAYVIAHEIGHHVQNLMGVLDGARDKGASSRSVRVELQADCFAGVWAHSTRQRNLLETGDIEEALVAASAIGDDALQQQSSGVVRPETFSHGTSEQRMRWFRRGLQSGDMKACNALQASTL